MTESESVCELGQSRLHAVLAVVSCFSTISACSPAGSVGDDGKPIDVGGTYSVSVQYGANACAIPNWPEGNTLSNIDFVLTQDVRDLSAVVGGIPGGVLGLLHGSNEYKGELLASDAELTIYGTIPQTRGNCSFTFNNYLDVTFAGDFMRGTIRFSPALSDNPDCESVACVTEMTLNGSRPPKG